MALKVLLADDSAAIKKVVQLSLQDFGADVKSVGSGKDVLDICRSFHPDIAFVDVLLPHKTGYEVVTEMKKDANLKQTPVVMLWSAFMAFDEGKFKASGADEKLEKPFEVAGLRQLVSKLVPKMQTNPVAKHLDFPKVEFDQPIGSVPPAKKTEAPPTPKPADPAPQSAEAWSMASFEDIGNFTGQMKELQNEKKTSEETASGTSAGTSAGTATVPLPPTTSSENNWSGDDQWIRKELTSKFKVPVPEESAEENTVSFQYNESEINDTSFLFKPQTGTQGETKTEAHGQKGSGPQPAMASKSEPAVDPVFDIDATEPLPAETIGGTVGGTATEVLPSSKSETQTQTQTKQSTLTPEDMEQIRSQTREIVEKAVWKIVPEIASQIIREEIQRILGEEK